MGHQCKSTIENLFMPEEAEIVRAEFMTPAEKHFTLRLKSGKAMVFEPGQMLEVSLFGFGEIPIGFASSPTRKGTFDIVVRSVGRVSSALNRLEKGDSLWVRAPLGKGFDLEKMRGRDVLVVAGGIGLCPTRSLINYILDRRSEFGKFTLFFGTKTPKDQLFREDLAQWRISKNVEFHETVDRADENWKGNVGVITTLFKNTTISPDTVAVICGPPVMYKFVIRDLDRIGIARDRIFVDLERRMKCGVGKCGHCQMNDLYVCMDGPVFPYSKVQDREEAFG
ncbi:MAG: hypothetical protein A2X97_10145 [Bdellovibrionales bacterium GWA1_52_35]|nr:MAG: hypothetical protein A2X97_10145 [Bdellovibrionales bacterium GWA1_52_35]HCM40539.1 oxidoreductase [Bdellovibrionales bacterium]